jgi:hypothetical protein
MRAILAASAAAFALTACQSAGGAETAASTSSAAASGSDAASRSPAPSAASPGTVAPDVQEGLQTPRAPPDAPAAPTNQSPENPR